MIKKISQLNRLPEKFYKEELFDQEDYDTLLRKKNEMLFEVSYETADTSKIASADEVNYYTSYSTTLSALEDIFGIKDIRNILILIRNGGLSVISGDLKIGTPGNATNDRVDSYRPDTSHSVTCYSDIKLENDLLVHGKTTFHNDVVLTCNRDVTNKNKPILEVQGVATFHQVINGTAYRAQWGDLAEMYSADENYEPGTLVAFGGKNEVTIAKEKANGVVTTSPGVILNSKDAETMEFPVGVAMAGKVPIKVRGPVRKFDKIVLSKVDPGIGVVYNYAFPYEVIGRALEENLDKETKLVLCATRMNLT